MKNFFSNNWTIGIGTALISTIVLKLIDVITGSSILLEGWHYIILIGTFFNVKYSLPLYALILLAFSALIGLALYIYIQEKISPTKQIEEAEPKWINYCQEIFEAILYKWSYRKVGDKYEISSITPFCPKCVCRIVHRKCPNCKNTFDHEYESYSHHGKATIKSEQEVAALIMRNIELKKYIQP